MVAKEAARPLLIIAGVQRGGVLNWRGREEAAVREESGCCCGEAAGDDAAEADSERVAGTGRDCRKEVVDVLKMEEAVTRRCASGSSGGSGVEDDSSGCTCAGGEAEAAISSCS